MNNDPELDSSADTDNIANEDENLENPEVKILNEKIMVLSDENAQLKEQMMRAMADLQNMRKRFAQEKIALTQFATEDLIVDLLPILDNFERTISAADGGASTESVLGGVRAIDRQFRDILGRRNLTRIQATGQEFDPEEHFALAAHETDEVPENTVTQEIEAGYKLAQKVVRPAKVRVAKKP
jgi:molecular chaperone GrpE